MSRPLSIHSDRLEFFENSWRYSWMNLLSAVSTTPAIKELLSEKNLKSKISRQTPFNLNYRLLSKYFIAISWPSPFYCSFCFSLDFSECTRWQDSRTRGPSVSGSWAQLTRANTSARHGPVITLLINFTLKVIIIFFLISSLFKESLRSFFWIFFWRARVCWPLLCVCRPFCIFERCLWIRTQRAAM